MKVVPNLKEFKVESYWDAYLLSVGMILEDAGFKYITGITTHNMRIINYLHSSEIINYPKPIKKHYERLGPIFRKELYSYSCRPKNIDDLYIDEMIISKEEFSILLTVGRLGGIESMTKYLLDLGFKQNY